VHVEATGASTRKDICGQYGAPAIAVYEANGVRFEINLDPSGANRSRTAYLNLIAAPDVVISIPEHRIRIRLPDRGINDSMIMESKTVSRLADGRLTVATDHPGNAIYQFDLAKLPRIDSRGTLDLPMIYAFSFERRTFVGVVPLNC
jgi:hypothetical protein